MERRNAQVFDVEEATELEESIDVSAPTVVVSAAPLQACMRASALTVRHVPPARLPGKSIGTRPPPRRAQTWASVANAETAPVGTIPMPGERASAAVTIVQRAAATPSGDSRVTIVQRPVATSAGEPPVAIVQRPAATHAGEAPLQYSVERAVAASAPARSAEARWPHKQARQINVLVLIIGVLAGFVTVLSVVVVGQQRELQANDDPARRATAACAAYAAEVDAIARELTQAAGAVADVEARIGDRARRLIDERALQLVCTGEVHRCAEGDVACVAAAVMQLRQALSR